MSPTTSPRSAARVAVVGVVGDDDAEAARCAPISRGSAIGTAGLVSDPRPLHDAQAAGRDDAKSAGRADRLRRRRRSRRARSKTRSSRRSTQLAASADAILISDYLKGAVSRGGRRQRPSPQPRRRSIPLLVDPKVPHIDYYSGATVITPNHHEAEAVTHMRIRTERRRRCAAARRFRERAGCESVLITRGEHGMTLLGADGEAKLPAEAREVADVTGAGDTVIATMALALAAGASLVEAARLANRAAGIVVGKFGPATVRSRN